MSENPYVCIDPKGGGWVSHRFRTWKSQGEQRVDHCVRCGKKSADAERLDQAKQRTRISPYAEIIARMKEQLVSAHDHVKALEAAIDALSKL